MTSEFSAATSALCRRIAELPPGAVMRWHEASASSERPFAVDWAAVQSSQLQADDASGRLWLVVAPGTPLGEHHPAELTIEAEPDLDVHAVFDPEARRDAVVITAPRDGALRATDDGALRSAAERLGVEVSISPGWSVARISELLRGWIASRCARTDVLVEFDPAAGRVAEPPEKVRQLGFTDMAQFTAVVRVGRGSVDVGLAAMRERDRSAAAERLLQPNRE